MQNNFDNENIIVGIVGLGAMGRGIAQIAATAGIKVLMYDAIDGVTDDAINFIDKMLKRSLEKKRIDENTYKRAINKLTKVNTLEDLKDCNIIVEAVKEDINIKKELFVKLENIVSENCILATNTSSLSVTDIASSCKKPYRVAGYHFFNPVPLMKVVEIVKAERTSDSIIDFLQKLAIFMGHNPVITKDTPGFIVNHVGRGYSTEAMAMFTEEIAQVDIIDSILKKAAGFPMGPFELFDLTGLDVSLPASISIYNGFYQDPRYRPSYKFNKRLEAGLLGRKVGEGFYIYKDGKKIDNEKLEKSYSNEDIDFSIWVSKKNKEGYEKVIKYLKSKNYKIDYNEAPKEESLCIITPFGLDATTTAINENLDPSRVIAVDTFYGFDNCKTLMGTLDATVKYKNAALSIFSENSEEAYLISDSPGFVVQRVLSMIVNIACAAAEQKIASPSDIDKAVKLGLGYPYGPLEWGDLIGASKINYVLNNLSAIYKDQRYRPTLWLKRRALLSKSLLEE